MPGANRALLKVCSQSNFLMFVAGTLVSALATLSVPIVE
jgi:hypothetical protein